MTIYVDDCEVAVDLRVLNRDRHVRQQLRLGASLTVRLGDDVHFVPLMRKPTAFGGERTFAVCPACSKPVGVLREAPSGEHRLACKACLGKLGARYRSQEHGAAR